MAATLLPDSLRPLRASAPATRTLLSSLLTQPTLSHNPSRSKASQVAPFSSLTVLELRCARPDSRSRLQQSRLRASKLGLQPFRELHSHCPRNSNRTAFGKDGHPRSQSRSSQRISAQPQTQSPSRRSPLPDLPSGCPPETVLTDLFGPNVLPQHGYYFLKALQFRRTSGTLIERGVGFELYPHITHEIGARALEWLRKEFPVDEEAAAHAWISQELREAEEAARESLTHGLIERAEKWKIYKKEEHQSHSLEAGEDKGALGRELSVLDALRRENERRYEEQLERERVEREKKAEEARAEGKDLVQADESKSFWDRVVAKTPEQEAQKEIELKEGMVSQAEEPPEMSTYQRLFPSAVFTAIVLVACIAYAHSYIPAAPSDRLFPSVPPSALTVSTLIAANTAIFLAWRRPEFWKFLNSYAIIVVGQPVRSSMLLSVFSHTAGWHFIANMTALWTIGTRLHEIVPRGDFLALYLSSGVIASYATLVQFTLLKNFHTASLGASGAIWGILAAYLVLVPDQVVPLTIDWSSSLGWKKEIAIPSMSLLGILLLVDQALAFVPRMGMVGRGAHLVGAIAGFVGAQVLKLRGTNEKLPPTCQREAEREAKKST